MIKQKLQSDQISAMKSGDKQKLEVLRYILSQIKNKEIEKRQDLSEEEIVAILRKQAKELTESTEAFEKGGRSDLVENNKMQLDILSAYLPEEMSDADLMKEIEKIKAENKEMVEKNPRALIGMCVAQLKSKADPTRISKLVMSLQ